MSAQIVVLLRYSRVAGDTVPDKGSTEELMMERYVTYLPREIHMKTESLMLKHQAEVCCTTTGGCVKV